MILRPYNEQDKDVCLTLFDTNVGTYFMPHERTQFSAFLEKLPGDYFVVEDEQTGKVVGCGGIALNSETGEGNLTWGMVDRHQHRMGIGKFLTTTRLERLRQIPGCKYAAIQTSQHTAAFYARFGFEVSEIIKDGFGIGLDNYKMRLVLEKENG